MDEVLVPNFVHQDKETMENGTTSEKTLFRYLHIPDDLGEDGKDVPMTAGTTREWEK